MAHLSKKNNSCSFFSHWSSVFLFLFNTNEPLYDDSRRSEYSKRPLHDIHYFVIEHSKPRTSIDFCDFLQIAFWFSFYSITWTYFIILFYIRNGNLYIREQDIKKLAQGCYTSRKEESIKTYIYNKGLKTPIYQFLYLSLHRSVPMFRVTIYTQGQHYLHVTHFQVNWSQNILQTIILLHNWFVLSHHLFQHLSNKITFASMILIASKTKFCRSQNISNTVVHFLE